MLRVKQVVAARTASDAANDGRPDISHGNSRVLLTSTSRPGHVLKREVALLKRGNLVTSPSPYPPQEGTTCTWESAVYWVFSLGNGCNAARLRPVCQLGLEANPQDICDVCKQLAPKTDHVRS